MGLTSEISRVREFNRFYTNIISVLDQSVLNSGFSLAEARVLFEIDRLQPCSAREIMELLTIDEGYLSRILNKFNKHNWVERTQSKEDRRTYFLALSELGKSKIDLLETIADQSTYSMISQLSEEKLDVLLKSMKQIKDTLTNNEND